MLTEWFKMSRRSAWVFTMTKPQTVSNFFSLFGQASTIQDRHEMQGMRVPAWRKVKISDCTSVFLLEINRHQSLILLVAAYKDHFRKQPAPVRDNFCFLRVSAYGSFDCNWRGAWNQALSDTWCNVKFSFCFISKYKAIWKENLAVNHTSLRAFFNTPLWLLLMRRVTDEHSTLWILPLLVCCKL